MKMNKTVKIEDGGYTDTWKKIQLLPENDMGPFCFGTGYVLCLQPLFSSRFVPRLITIHSSRSSSNSTTRPQQAINALLSVASVLQIPVGRGTHPCRFQGLRAVTAPPLRCHPGAPALQEPLFPQPQQAGADGPRLFFGSPFLSLLIWN